MLFLGLVEFACIIGIPVTLIGFITPTSPSDDTEVAEVDDSTETNSPVEIETSQAETSHDIEEVATDTLLTDLVNLGFSEQNAEGNRTILLRCGISDITGFESTDTNASIDDLIVYRYEEENKVMWFTVENQKIFYVSVNGVDLYDESKGGYLATVDDVHIPETDMTEQEKSELRDMTESILDKHFGYDTRYYDAWGVGREDDNYMVQCQVSDGSILTDDWVYAYVWYERVDGEFKATNMKIDGTVYELN